ncbi:MAG TPA: hotdog fold thioesterase [Steroidobacteraceae bacterium]|nr:hotdog fold thioesterase [Steroidobacteraceae bacterium]
MSIWKSARTLEQLNSYRSSTLAGQLGMEFTEIGADYLRGTMPVDARTHQPYGLLHGGASVALAETLGSMGASLCVDMDQFQCLGQEINANHLRPVRAGIVTGTARPIHIGGRSHVWSIEIANAGGRLVCISRLTVAIVRRGVLRP